MVFVLTAHNNAQDWAARAKEWANARAAMENQPVQQFTPVGRPEEHAQSNVQYPQGSEYHYPDAQQQSLTTSSYQQFPVAGVPPHQPPMAYQHGTSSGKLYPDGHVQYNASRDGSSAGEGNVEFARQESSHTSPSVHQQEVPSSYSSVAGNHNSLSI